VLFLAFCLKKSRKKVISGSKIESLKKIFFITFFYERKERKVVKTLTKTK
jgi:hypothetical protein